MTEREKQVLTKKDMAELKLAPKREKALKRLEKLRAKAAVIAAKIAAAELDLK